MNGRIAELQCHTLVTGKKRDKLTLIANANTLEFGMLSFTHVLHLSVLPSSPPSPLATHSIPKSSSSSVIVRTSSTSPPYRRDTASANVIMFPIKASHRSPLLLALDAEYARRRLT